MILIRSRIPYGDRNALPEHHHSSSGSGQAWSMETDGAWLPVICEEPRCQGSNLVFIANNLLVLDQRRRRDLLRGGTDRESSEKSWRGLKCEHSLHEIETAQQARNFSFLITEPQKRARIFFSMSLCLSTDISHQYQSEFWWGIFILRRRRAIWRL